VVGFAAAAEVTARFSHGTGVGGRRVDERRGAARPFTGGPASADTDRMPGSRPSRILALRRADICVRCGSEVAAGTEALWDPGPRSVTCLTCVTGTPGGAARREYQRRHDRREQHARDALGVVGVALARVTAEPQSTVAWKRGAEGEERVAHRLAAHLDGHGLRTLHDRRMSASSRANIDHIIIGPGGVTVVDAKYLQGNIRVDRVGGPFSGRRTRLLVGGRDRSRLIDGVKAQVAAVARVVARGGHPEVDVRGALCLADVGGLPWFGTLRVGDVLIDGPRRVARLARRPGSVTPQQVDGLLALLSEALPQA
jgi:hypothetical protein